MAVDMTLKCGKIKGESVIAGHEGEIDVLSFAFGGTQSGTMHTALAAEQVRRMCKI